MNCNQNCNHEQMPAKLQGLAAVPRCSHRKGVSAQPGGMVAWWECDT
jgi:hypothetical protein